MHNRLGLLTMCHCSEAEDTLRLILELNLLDMLTECPILSRVFQLYGLYLPNDPTEWRVCGFYGCVREPRH